MAKKTAKKPATRGTDAGSEAGVLSSDLYGLGKEIEGVAEELHPLWHLEALADNVGHLAEPLSSLATAVAMKTLIEHGTEEDRQAALAHLKRIYLE